MRTQQLKSCFIVHSEKRQKSISKRWLTVLGVFLPSLILAQVSGTVYRDFNANGVKDNTATFNEIGGSGVVVTAYDNVGVSVATTTSATNGSYSFTGLTLPLRIEFTGLPTNSHPSSAGGTCVQFYTAASSNADFGFNFPDDYIDSFNPKLVVPNHVNGNPLGGGTSGLDMGLVRWDYSDSGQTGGTNNEVIATNAQKGTTWGTAYQRQQDRLFTSAYVKRHSGLGTAGIGGLYIVNNAKTSPSPSITSFDLTTLGLNFGSVLDNTARGLQADKENTQHDPSTYAQVGNVGIGGIATSADGSKLYLVNLFEQKLHILNITGASPTLISSHIIPNPGCSGGTWKPFAVSEYHGVVYVGGVCNAINSQNTADLSAYVYAFDGTNFTSVFNFNLDYPKGQAFDACPSNTGWYPWSDVENTPCHFGGGYTRIVYPQPILSNIDFDIDGSMILNFLDRLGDQEGWISEGVDIFSFNQRQAPIGGDIIRICNIGGSYVLQGSGICANNQNNGEGPGLGEFYYADSIGSIAMGRIPHQETSFGSGLVLPGFNQLINVLMDPLVFASGGIRVMNASNGTLDWSYEIYNDTPLGSTLGKANGLSDIELMSAPAPIEIGNRVWEDLDADGIQDAGEPGLSGVSVELRDNTNALLATAITDANGNYYFSNASGASTGSYIKGLSLTYGAAYTLAFPITATGVTAPYAGASIPLVIFNNDLTSNGDARDSDPSSTTGIFSFILGNAGQNNYTFDAGYSGVVFPVNILSFTGKLKGKDGILNWVTTDENNLAGFEILRSFDGQNFQQISIVPAKGNSISTNNYEIRDENLAFSKADKVYYRLISKDFDGTESTSNLVELALKGNKNLFAELYPNPVSAKLFLNYQVDVTTQVEVLNTIGEVVYTNSLAPRVDVSTVEINTENWANGIYFVRLSNRISTQILKVVK